MTYRGWKPEILNSTAGLLSLVNQSGHIEPQKVQAADAEGPKYAEEHTTCLGMWGWIFFFFYLENAQLLEGAQ